MKRIKIKGENFHIFASKIVLISLFERANTEDMKQSVNSEVKIIDVD